MKTQEDTLVRGKIKIRQLERGNKVSMDTILLAKAAGVSARRLLVADVGAGSGAVALMLAHFMPKAKVFALEVEADLAALCRENAALNGFDISVYEGDVLKVPTALRELDMVFTNPPFFTGRESPDRTRAGARIERDLAGWLAGCVKMLKNGGTLCLVHDAGKIDKICAELSRLKMGAIEVLPVFSFASDAAAIRIVVRAKKASRAPAKILSPLVIHVAGGKLTAAAEEIINGEGFLPFT